MRRLKSLRRRESVRSAKTKFFIYTEGKNTEPDYFRALEETLNGAIVELEVIGPAGVPLTLVGSAVEKLRSLRKTRRDVQSFEKNDQVWAVFDRDEHPGVADAIQRCVSTGVGMAFSDPCFEVWLILHKNTFDKCCDRHEVQKHLEKCCPEYDRNSRKTANCRELIKSLDQAEQRADQQKQRRAEEGDAMGAPNTSVQNLTREIRKASSSFTGDAAKKRTD